MKRFKMRLNNISLRAKLTISFIAMIVLSLAIMAFGYFIKSSDVILSNASQTSLGLVRMSNQSIEAELDRVEQSAINMHLDADFFQFFNTGDFEQKSFDYESDRKITRTLQKYFPTSANLFSVNLVTKDFTFGESPSFWIPRKEYSQFNIYKIGQQSIRNTSWIPTYNLLEQFYSTAPTDREQYVFTAARLMNFAMVRNNILIQMDDHIERPVLIVNFSESMLENALKGSLTVDDSYYTIFTSGGSYVSSSAQIRNQASVSQEWIRHAVAQKSGTEYITIDGRKMVVCFDTMKVTGWLSAVFIPYDNLKKTVPNMNDYTIYSMVLIALLSILLASFLSGRIVLPLTKLMYGINRMGDGNFNNKIELSDTKEVNVIIRKFNQMNDNIHNLIIENYETHLKEMEAELKALNFQFNPHFLYNTLNIINYLAIENKQALISRMLVELSEMLEYTAKNTGKVIFSKDVQYLKNYVFIMSSRFEDKFSVTYDIDPALYHYSVPKFFLQPFIENALIHGLEDMVEGGTIHVLGKMEENSRIFAIQDNGKGMSRETIRRVLRTDDDPTQVNSSIGIKNVNQRIKLLYGSDYGVQIISEIGHGTTVSMVLPLE
ncbi:sensor histidine kinase [Paenibacillus sp. 2TAB23]|uniref:sensor histidine kinase n=1 Tax=Paenibacillus sp. 2TAB23 TaxID=3233004 RepID=UPI003F97F2C6